MRYRRRTFARLLALLLLTTLLFSRLAAAGYLCPQETSTAMGSAAMATMTDCLDMDDAQPALCADRQHGSQHWADSNAHPADFAALPAAEFSHVLRLAASIGRLFPTAPTTNFSSGPIYLATARLRN